MKFVPPPAFIIVLLMIAFPGFSSFAFTVHVLPNSRFFHTAWFSDRNALNLSSVEKEARDRQAEAEEREEREWFDDAQTKADLALIEQIVTLLKAFHLEQIETILGPRQKIQEHYLLPAAFPRGGITLSGHQEAGEASTAFFPIGELGGVYVIQYEKRKTISAGAIYLKRDHSFRTDRRTGDRRIEAREAERPECKAIQAALERRITAYRPE